MTNDADKIDLYLIHATLDPNSGSLIGFPPSIQGLPTDSTVAGLVTLLGNLHSMGQIGDTFAPAAVARMQFWASDGTTLASTQPLIGLPEPRVVVIVSWASDPVPVLPTAQARPLVESFFDYARKNDGNFATFFGDNEVAFPAGAVREVAYEVLIRFAFLADKIDVTVERAGQVHLSFAAEVTPSEKLSGYGLETTFGAAAVPPIGEFPVQLAQIAVTLEQKLSCLDSLESDGAAPVVHEICQALANDYVQAADICPVNSRFVRVQ